MRSWLSELSLQRLKGLVSRSCFVPLPGVFVLTQFLNNPERFRTNGDHFRQ